MMIAAYSYRLDVFEGGSSSTGARFIDLKALLEVFGETKQTDFV